MRQYLDLLGDVLNNGERREDRTGTGTLSVFGRQIRVNLQEGFPALTTKRVNMRAVWHELIWFLRAETHIMYLRENGVKIWDPWASDNGYVGPMYGVQWRKWSAPKDSPPYIDQLEEVIDSIRTNPTSRRHLVSAWNPAELQDMALPPCHYSFQFYVRGGKYLDILVNQRSADMFLGVPFDIASYATLCHIIAHLTGLEAGEMVYNFGDTHIYLNHLEQVEELLSREPKRLPKLVMRNFNSLNDVTYDKFYLVDYDPHPPIKAPISV